jgi:hypothetical protein
MAVGPETAKSAILASSWCCPESAVDIKEILTDRGWVPRQIPSSLWLRDYYQLLPGIAFEYQHGE